MQLVAKNTDILSRDHSSKAKMTWITRDIYTRHAMNTSGSSNNGWAGTEIRTWLRTVVLPLLPEVIQNNIKVVDKTYRTKVPNDTTLTIEDTIWIPSLREIGLTNSSYIESEGPIYSSLFNSDASRIKYTFSNDLDWWWTRTTYNSNGRFSCSSTTGTHTYSSSSSIGGVVFGFCL